MIKEKLLKLLGLNYSKWYVLKTYNKGYNSYLLQARVNIHDNSIQFKSVIIAEGDTTFSSFIFESEFEDMVKHECSNFITDYEYAENQLKINFEE